MSNIIDQLNDKQKEAVLTLDGPLLVVAGPGSGKTKVLTHRIAYLIQQGIAPQNILAVTFTNKAANEMKERVQKLLARNRFAKPGTPAHLPTLGTFHSVCARLLRSEASFIGFKKDFVIFDDKDSLALIKKVMNELEISDDQFNPQSIQNTISSAKNELIGPEFFSQNAQGYFQEVVAKVFGAYQTKLKKANAMDFDDLLSKTVELFSSHREILENYQNKFKYILVDEYQDTNHSQYVLINLLAQKYRNICAVGDFDQSIYSFRGADFRNILNFEKDYPQARLVFLEENYRSTKNILEAAHSIIIKNANRKEKNLFTQNAAGNPVVLFSAKDEQDEGTFVIEQINRLKKQEGLSFKDFTVLYRTNAQSRAIEESFLRYGFPYKVIGTFKFYERKEIKDLLSYLRFLQNPLDLLSLERIINLPPRGLGKFSAEEYLKIEKISLSQFTPKKLKALENFQNLISDLRQTAKILPLSQTLKQIIEKTALRDYLRNGTEEGESRWENVNELFTVTKKYDPFTPGEGLTAFLEEAALLSNHDEVETEKDVANLMTLHCAKGLEFPVVFIIGCEEGLFPHSRSMLDAWQMEEERRLCYVGVTRAKQHLYLTWAQQRNLYGSIQVNPPSRFLFDIPKNLIDLQGEEGGLNEYDF
ncbi:MAG: ATP-dependent DNA helicase PcrA [Candidatus Portnoybacteria bacterium CG11_big_fil_rev_8_21_14_0_20_40_15]|uniref:DNA 3'-5' helicase n=1 Tax=Candidatus Portnoybacteria bacterium CG11_big_fil_rev_8_21_14_0_20_40_15 TaxID=1974817 RepID=A0A2H0KTA2_9BACT|nr:MAG: ATP-dependent DNA helicase PcrA [Candidatus Portnoybacteria bacterium CG11_big_fil_rev_8_21_14_0_20_40_15]